MRIGLNETALRRGVDPAHAGHKTTLTPQPDPLSRAERGPSGERAAVPVLFIGGWGRCGSTLLDMLLGQVTDVLSVGEVREIWLRGCVENRPCGCGLAFHQCPFWVAVGERAFGGWDAVDLPDLLKTRYSLDRPWGIARIVLPGRGKSSRALDRYCDALSRLYSAIRDVSGAEVVVDSSKLSSHALLLRRSKNIDVRVVHLVRDSRGVAYSLQQQVEKRVTTGASTMLPQHGPLTASLRYALYNGLTDALRLSRGAQMRLRYEDLMDDPARHLRRILGFAGDGVATGSLDFLSGNVAKMRSNHMVDGNPIRFITGSVILRRDERWRDASRRGHRALVAALTLPFLVAYGYVRADRRHRPDA